MLLCRVQCRVRILNQLLKLPYQCVDPPQIAVAQLHRHIPAAAFKEPQSLVDTSSDDHSIMSASTLILIFSLHCLLLFLHQTHCKNLSSITQFLPLHDGDVLLSEDGNYALGFFSPGNSAHRFIGIWYRHSISSPR